MFHAALDGTNRGDVAARVLRGGDARDAFKWRVASPGSFLKTIREKTGTRDISDDHVQIFLLKPFVLTMSHRQGPILLSRGWKPRRQDPGRRLNAASEVFQE